MLKADVIKFMDFSERVERCFLYNKKENRVPVQIMYTNSWMNEVAEAHLNGGYIFDRSPLSDIWYYYIKKYMNPFSRISAKKEFLDLIKHEEFLSLLSMYPTVIVLLNITSEADKKEFYKYVRDTMKRRSNGLDTISVDYVAAQQDIFQLLIAHCEEKLAGVIHISRNNIYTNYLRDALLPHIPARFYNKSFTRGYQNDAGIDLTLIQDYHFKKNVPTRVIFEEDGLVIPKNYFGQLTARSSVNLMGTLRSGIIDAEYNGRLSTVFIADQDFQASKGTRFAQLVIIPLAPLPDNLKNKLVVLKEGTRGTCGFGSTNS